MRLTGGSARGRRLASPPPGVRPTSQRARQALFDVLGARVAGAHVVDLFAGTGALGLEALSRGAAGCAFVERDRRAVARLRHNVERAGFGANARVVARDVFAWLRTARESAQPLLVLADPPWAPDAALRVVRAVAASRLAVGGGLLVVEHRAAQGPDDCPAEWVVTDERRWGDVAMTFLERVTNDEAATP